MSKQTAHIYQDESGSLADPAGTVVIIALVAVLDPWSLRFITKKVYKNFLAKFVETTRRIVSVFFVG